MALTLRVDENLASVTVVLPVVCPALISAAHITSAFDFSNL
jgi:ABC-type transport system involved in cytochrome c biogenesis permease component